MATAAMTADLHPTMYLLILEKHYFKSVIYIDLHPTMYLLILIQEHKQPLESYIYIPLCIY